mmetsp:Transcript_139334/g.445540  ORF Transcript_139334/g.445540 Transcript_139334/m.445540 type:complete len:230 (+) Transcript_139334:1534-2223(+)
MKHHQPDSSNVLPRQVLCAALLDPMLAVGLPWASGLDYIVDQLVTEFPSLQSIAAKTVVLRMMIRMEATAAPMKTCRRCLQTASELASCLPLVRNLQWPRPMTRMVFIDAMMAKTTAVTNPCRPCMTRTMLTHASTRATAAAMETCHHCSESAHKRRLHLCPPSSHAALASLATKALLAVMTAAKEAMLTCRPCLECLHKFPAHPHLASTSAKTLDAATTAATVGTCHL